MPLKAASSRTRDARPSLDEMRDAKTSHDDHLTFARHNFDNHQSLIRAADAKAGFLLTFLLFLGASTVPLGGDAVPKMRWIACGGALSSALYLASYGIFGCGFVWTLWKLHSVVSPRRAKHYSNPLPGRELIYFEHVIQHASSAEYFESVSRASSDVLLRNLTDQVFELAHICNRKMAAIRSSSAPFAATFLAWLANIGLGLWIVRWK